MFVDEATVEVSSGAGGDGCVSFRREKYVPRGGPDGGDGGDGGRVIFQVDPRLRTLVRFRYRRVFRAKRGGHGQGKNKTGRRGRDVVVRVPTGTVIKDERGRVLADLVEPGKRAVFLEGGRGGRGNARFASATHQAPRRAERGQPGRTLGVTLELKLLADVGLVGLPNAGKSTLLRRVSAARPKVASYPFTTLAPWLGVVQVDDETSFVLADLPGLIEGAHGGRGLGSVFLRHVERTSVLVLVIDLFAGDARSQYDTLLGELRRYSPTLVEKPRVVALNKVDLFAEPPVARGLPEESFLISGLLGEGVPQLLRRVAQLVGESPPAGLDAGSGGVPKRGEGRGRAE